MLVNGERFTTNVKRNVNNHLKDDTLNVTLNVKLNNRAQHLVDMFEREGCTDAKNCFYFFRKCFANLSEATIWDIYENATNNPNIDSPIKYFIAGCRNQMALKGV